MPVTFAKKVDSWDLMNTRLRPKIQELPELEPEQKALEAVLGEARGLQAEQELLRARLREMVRQRQEAEKRGQELRGRIAALLRGKLGFTSEQLIGYGIVPRRKTRRRKGVEEPAPPEAPPSTPQPGVRALLAAPPADDPAE
jgi:hypothetical protein